MKYPLYFILTTIFVANAVGWTARGNYYNADNPGKCTFSEQLIISPGEKVSHPEKCATVYCNDAEGNVSIAGCGKRIAPPNCKWGEPIDKDAPYPGCCYRHMICEDLTVQIAYENMHNTAHPRRFIGYEDTKPF